MKKVILTVFALFFFSAFTVYGYTSPGKPTGYINDFANIISDGTQADLEAKLTQFFKESSVQIAVVTVPTLGDEVIEYYAVKLFEEWGIGNKDKDTGILFLVALNERKLRIETGYGIEGALTDVEANAIINQVVVPEFKQGNMEAGIVKGAEAIIGTVKGEVEYTETKSNAKNYEIIVIIVWFCIYFIFSILARSKSWWLGGVLGGVVGIILGFIFGFLFTGIIAIIGLTILGLIIDFFASKYHGKGGPGGFFGGFGGGSSSSGFGGFGGGGSGGGGSSGSW